MTKQDEGVMLDVFVKAFHEVVVPILEDHGKKLDEISETVDGHTKILDAHTKKLDEHTKILDAHTRKLDEISETVDEHTKKLDEISETVDAHTASLVEMEKIPVLVGDIHRAEVSLRKKVDQLESKVVLLS